MARYTLAHPLAEGHVFTEDGTPTGKAVKAGSSITLTAEQARTLRSGGYLAPEGEKETTTSTRQE